MLYSLSLQVVEMVTIEVDIDVTQTGNFLQNAPDVRSVMITIDTP